MLKRGFEFTHTRMLDPRWKPGPGERYADGPKAIMVITRVTKHTIYFKYAHDSERAVPFSLDRRAFELTYLKDAS